MKYRRTLLGFVLGAIALTAVLGLYAVLVPDFGELQAKILGTSAAISGASIAVLAFTPAWERQLALPLPVVGAAFVMLALVLGLVGMWAEVDRPSYGKVLGTAIFLASWSLLVCLLVLATLPQRYRWTFYAAAGLTFALTAVSIAAMWLEPTAGVGRAVGALAVLSAAFVLTVPVLYRATRAEVRAVEAPAGSGFCPRCGSRARPPTADELWACGRCGARFRVSFVEAEAGHTGTAAFG